MGRKSGGTKTGRAINPADAHRKAQRKRELKKNKEERKRVRLVTTAQKDTRKIVQQLNKYGQLDSLDTFERTKRQQLEEKLKKINESRKQLGLAPVDPTAESSKTKSKEEVEMKWYHPTFNPHGPKKPARRRDDEESDEESDSSEDAETSEDESEDERLRSAANLEPEPMLQFDDLSNIPLPEGPTPDTEAQIYETLELPEIRNKADHKPSPTAEPQPSATTGKSTLEEMRTQPHGLPQRPLGPPFTPMGHMPYGPHFAGPGIPPLGQYRPPIMHGPPSYGHGMPYGHPGPYGPTYAAAAPYMLGPGRPPFMGYPLGQPQPTNAPHETHVSSELQRAPAPVIAAAPQVRDLQAESVRLVPAALRRKKASAPVTAAKSAPKPASRGLKPIVNAAPNVDEDIQNGQSTPAPQTTTHTASVKTKTANDEYDEFMRSMKDLL